MKLLSPWAEKTDLKNPLPEYPRMQLQRGSFYSLNGMWQFQITAGQQPDPLKGWSDIVVPFAPGSALSGTNVNLLPGEVLWMRRQFNYTPEASRTFLNFEAVDQSCIVYLNGMEIGSHKGGYTPFSLNVSEQIRNENELLVRIRDDTEKGLYGYGRQKTEPGGLWHTPAAGIWQTVWLEDLPVHALEDIKITPDFSQSAVYLHMAGTFSQMVITVFAGRELVHRGITSKMEYTIPLQDVHAWSPDDPFLYTMYLQTDDETVKSYFAMRRFETMRDSSGFSRFALNGRPLFLSGVLDLGYNTDGNLTYPNEEAMAYDIKKAKELGFNMIRKHGKVENRRWYYLCDKYGMLVMQDIPNGGGPYDIKRTSLLPAAGFRRQSDKAYEKNGRGSEESRKAYYDELYQILDTLYNFACIFAWVAFHEGWGQFDSEAVTKAISDYDTTRLIDSASGWFDNGAGDFDSRHCYHRAFRAPKPENRILLLSEFGGYAFAESGHHEAQKIYGVKKYEDKAKWNAAVLEQFERDVLHNIPKGLSGAVYNQLADTEDECCGLISADRRIVKIDARRMRRLNERCYRTMKK